MKQSEILKAVEWRDLRNLSLSEMLIENNLSIPGHCHLGYLRIGAIFGWHCLVQRFSF
jgi:hypothetical protein